MALALVSWPTLGRAQAALLMEEPYGFFGSINPTGHNAIYFARICAETPVKLRRCQAGELGAVIARYEGINGYDWVAMPLHPYLYSVDDASAVPARVNHREVSELRDSYREAHLLGLGDDLPDGGLTRGGWTQLVGVSYERRIYAFRFETAEAQDDTLIALLNDSPNRSDFHLLTNNCSDFARIILDYYFPGVFQRGVFPDAGVTTPKQIAFKLERYARKHPENLLTVLVIPQIPGYRRHSRSNKGIAESLTTTGYAVPIALLNPYLAGGLFVDYLVRGRHHLIPKDSLQLSPGNLFALTAPARAVQNPVSAGLQVSSATVGDAAQTKAAAIVNFDLTENKVAHE
jgi:hypothetical protein